MEAVPIAYPLRRPSDVLGRTAPRAYHGAHVTRGEGEHGLTEAFFGGSEPEPTVVDEPTDLGDLREQLPDSVLGLHAGVGGIDLVGESYCLDAIDRVVRGPYDAGVRATYWAELVPETNNTYDANAVAVRINGELVGYLSRPDAKRYRSVLEDLRAAGRQAAVRCDVRYGWNRRGEERGHYGLRVYMDAPDRQAELLAKEGISVRAKEPPKQLAKAGVPTLVRASSPPKAMAKAQSRRVSWRTNPRESSGYEGYVGNVHVADIEKAYGPERWIWTLRVPVSGEDRGWPALLRDAKTEAEEALANWQS